jgi:hypothetical protein
LSPTLFGLFAADLVNHLKRKFHDATILHKGQQLWVSGFLYVDDLCLLSTKQMNSNETRPSLANTWKCRGF